MPFLKGSSACLPFIISVSLRHLPSSHFFLLVWVFVDTTLICSGFAASSTADMKHMNRTILLSLLSKCQNLLEDTDFDFDGQRVNTTLSFNTSTSTNNSSGKTYDNAYFYILFVFFFYTFLAMTLFKCVLSEDKKDPYEDFINTGQSSGQKFNTDKFDFEEEGSF